MPEFDKPRRMELNPGEMFMVGDPTILVESFESIIAFTGKIGMKQDQIAHMLTFTGKRNNHDEQMTVTLLLHPSESNELILAMGHSLKHLVEQIEKLRETPDVDP